MKVWFSHGFWNTSEHLATRFFDVLTTLVLIRVFTPELFSKLVFAQAFLAPLLIVFIAPETIIYRDYSKWKEGDSGLFFRRIRTFRYFGYLKILFIFIFSGAAALFFPSTEFEIRFSISIWAFFWALGPQISGMDREYLRVSLKLKTLNLITILQKMLFLGGTLWVSIVFPEKLELLALVSLFSALLPAFVSSQIVNREFSSHLPLPLDFMIRTLKKTIQGYSLWTHLSGIITTWVMTMDLFFLGLFHYSDRLLGLYGITLKLAGFFLIIPIALANLFSVWIGTRKGDFLNQKNERKQIKKATLILAGVALVSGSIFLFLYPYYISFFSKGRWSVEETELVFEWLCAIQIGVVLYGLTFLYSSWMTLRSSAKKIFWQVSLPWGLLALLIYSMTACYGGINLTARANVAVSVLLIFLIYRSFRRA